MRRKSHPGSVVQQQAHQNYSFPNESQALYDQGLYSGQEAQIQLDYQERLKNRTLRDKRSNVLTRLASEEPALQKRPKKGQQKMKKHKIQQIGTQDITDIIIIVLLVLILGVSLFRVVMEVQFQFKKAQQQLHNYKLGQGSISEQPGHKENSQTNKANINLIKQPQIVISLTQQCQHHINAVLSEHGSLYDFKYPDKEMKTKSKLNGYVEGKLTFISRDKYAEAITLLRIVHRVDADGALVISGDACESEAVEKERLQKVMNQQFSRWNNEYQIDSYHSKQLRFCLVVNSYNNAKSGLIYRNIDSILQQNYSNYHIVYTDDASTDQTGKKVSQYFNLKDFPQSRLNLTINPTKNGMMQNIYLAVHHACRNGQIAVMLDGDDALVGVNVLSLLNALYQKEKPAVLWTNFVSIFNNNQVAMGFSHDYSEKQKADRSFRKMKGFISSHLKTFFVDVFKKIKPEDLQLNSGKFYGGASDTAMMLPMIEMASPRFKYLPEIVYEYRFDTGQTGNVVNKVAQKQALAKIFAGKPYERLKDFSFIEGAIEAAVEIREIQRESEPTNESTVESAQELKDSASN